MSLELKITPELRRLVKEYHDYHGDRTCRIVKVIYDEEGYPALLVRVRNCDGDKYSCIEGYSRDSTGDGYISEICSCPTEDEKAMVEWFESDKGAE